MAIEFIFINNTFCGFLIVCYNNQYSIHYFLRFVRKMVKNHCLVKNIKIYNHIVGFFDNWLEFLLIHFLIFLS